MNSLNEYRINSEDFDNMVNVLSGYPTIEYGRVIGRLYLNDFKNKFNELLENFLFKTRERFEFANFDAKLSSLSVKKLFFFQTFFWRLGGHYDINTHQVKVAYPIKPAIYHELFRAFTSFRINYDIYGTGFSYNSKFMNIGRIFNEGYTNYLSSEYFNNPINYGKMVNIAQKVELIIGKDEMEKMYSKNDLVKLINFLSSFSSFDNALKFLMLMDRYSMRDAVSRDDLIITNEISNYLVDIYINYLVTMYKNSTIDMGKLISRLEEFRIHFSDYIFKNEFEKQNYEKSSDYADIIHKLTRKHVFQVIDGKNF